jgi:chromosome segregation ATPase
MANLVAENEELRSAHIDNLKNSEDHSFGVNAPLSSEMMNQLQQQVKILMDENALLVEQKVVLSNELDKQQAQVEKQFNEINSLNGRIVDCQREIKESQQKALSFQYERDEAAKHALHCSDALGKAEQEIESLTEQLTLVKQKNKETEQEYQELKKQLKNMSLRYDEDGMTSLQKVKYAEDRVKELHLMISAKNQELENTNEVLRKLRSEYQSTRQDAEGMLQVMSGMERQSNEYASREETTNRLTSESRQKMEEAITIKEQVCRNIVCFL